MTKLCSSFVIPKLAYMKIEFDSTFIFLYSKYFHVHVRNGESVCSAVRRKELFVYCHSNSSRTAVLVCIVAIQGFQSPFYVSIQCATHLQ